MPRIKMIAGLGNPGKQYEHTRHNAGFWLVDRLADLHAQAFTSRDKFFGQLASLSIRGQKLHLLKPETFMNLSGKSVQALATFYRIEVDEILIVHDELDLDAGVVRLKTAGGHGGHNGLRDIDRALGKKSYHRLRIGINHPGQASKVTGHVLSIPGREEFALIQSAIDAALSQIENIVAGEFETAMQALHTRKS